MSACCSSLQGAPNEAENTACNVRNILSDAQKAGEHARKRINFKRGVGLRECTAAVPNKSEERLEV